MTAETSATAPVYTADFFVSHADCDLEWAEWIAVELEAAGYGVVVKAWDFRAGENLLSRYDEALATCRHTIAVISGGYVSSAIAERTAAQYQGLTGKDRALVPVRVDDCEVPPTLGPIISIDLRDVEEDEARDRLRVGLAGRVERKGRGRFPRKQDKRVRFPLAETTWELRGHRPDPDFTGRDDLLAALYCAFRAGRPTSSVQALTGLWGLGKTRLAIEYAHRHAAAYDVVWWIRAENQATLNGDYAELARALGLPFDQDSQAIAALRRRLRELRNWLIVFDNAEDVGQLFALLPDRHTGHVLITSQLRNWPQAESRPLTPLPAETAAAYLIERGKITDFDVAVDVAEALGGLPLALAQAASVIADGVGAEEYLSELRRDAPELFDEGEAIDYRRTVLSTWRASFTRLRVASTVAAELFQLGAFFAAEAVPLACLRPAPETPAELARVLTEPLRRRRATGALAEYSLAETAGGMLSIHRLVQIVTRAELGEDEPRWAALALGVLVASFPEEVGDPSTWPTCEALVSHAMATAEHAERLNVDVAAICTLRNRAARYLLKRGRWDRARAIVEQALTLAAERIPDDPAFYDCRNTQGLVLLGQGDYASALAAQEDVYAFRARMLGPDHLETLRAGCDLTEMLFVQGQWPRAVMLQDHLVNRFGAVVGDDDLETIKAIAYQATLVYDGGDYRRAQALEERVLEARSKALGDDHPDTLTAMANLAKTLQRQGKLDAARERHEHVLTARRRLLGDEHPSTLFAMSSLASTLFQQGWLMQAKTLEQQVLDEYKRLLGDEHPSTLTAIIQLASTLSQQGNFDGARDLQERVLDVHRRLFGDEHPRTADTLARLAATLSAQGELDTARSMRQKVLDVRRRLLGDTHPDTLRAMVNLAVTLRKQGDVDESLALLERALGTYRHVFGEDYPAALKAVTALVDTVQARGDLPAARALAERSLDGHRRQFGDEHLETLAASIQLAFVLVAAGEKEQADALLSQMLETGLRVFGKQNSIISQIAFQLMAIHDGPHDAAKRRSLQMHLSWLGKVAEGQLTAEQKKILDALRKSGHGPSGGTRRPPKRRRR